MVRFRAVLPINCIEKLAAIKFCLVPIHVASKQQLSLCVQLSANTW